MNVTLLVLLQLISKPTKKFLNKFALTFLMVIMIVWRHGGDLDTLGKARPLVCCIFVPVRPPVDGST